MPDRSREDRLDGELNICIMDALAQLVKRAATLGQALAARHGLSMTDLAGLHKLEEPMTMKELLFVGGALPARAVAVSVFGPAWLRLR